MCWAVFDIVENVKEDDLSLRPAFVFVDVCHHFFDGGESLLQLRVIRIRFGSLLKKVIQKEADGWKTLNGTDEQLLEGLPFALWVALTEFKESVKARLGAVAGDQNLFGLLEKIDERWVRFHQILRLLFNN